MRTRRTGRRMVSRRKREARRRVIRRRAMIGGCVLLLAGMAMTPELRTQLVQAVRAGIGAVQTFAQPGEAQAEVTLEEMRVYALQLGAYDSGERAQNEMIRLQGEDTLCVIWQREQMRLVCDAAKRKGALSEAAAQGLDAWVIEEEMPEVVLRVSAKPAELEAVKALLTLPDALFEKLCAQEEDLARLTQQTREQAQQALAAHPDHLLYTQLAQSLVNWCALMDAAGQTYGAEAALSYARVTISTLCYELRQTLLQENAQSAASTASAQRTPSTAAEVMPPA